jgi:hypothetical protein
MKRLISLISISALAACSVAFAQQEDVEVGNAKPMFAVLPRTVEATPNIGTAGTPLPTFNGSFTFQNQVFHYNMVGAAPSQNSTTTIQAIVIPIKIVITNGTSKTTFDPSHVLPNGKTVTANTTASPIFVSAIDFIQGHVDLGTPTALFRMQSSRTSTSSATSRRMFPPCLTKSANGRTIRWSTTTAIQYPPTAEQERSWRWAIQRKSSRTSANHEHEAVSPRSSPWPPRAVSMPGVHFAVR